MRALLIAAALVSVLARGALAFEWEEESKLIFEGDAAAPSAALVKDDHLDYICDSHVRRMQGTCVRVGV